MSTKSQKRELRGETQHQSFNLGLIPVLFTSSYACGRVSNRKSESMQNQSTSVFSSRSTLSKIETTPQISKALEKVRDNAILIISASAKNSYVTKPMRVVAEALTER